MNEDHFLIQVTARDYDVELIAENGRYFLYGAPRSGGSQKVAASQGPWISQVGGIWHFVLLEIQASNMTSLDQMHIPRFKMAQALSQQDLLFTSNSYPESIDAPWMPLPTKVHGRNKLAFVVNSSVELMLKESFVEKMKNDLPILEIAKERVRKSEEDQYYLPRVKTAAGHPVQSSSQKLIEAIAFERLCVKQLTAGNFGIYSAFCTYRDFETSITMPRDLIDELVEGQFACDPAEISDEILDLFGRVQKSHLSEPIWGKNIKSSKEKAIEILSETMEKLSRIQRVQFILMNGMHASGLFLPLAVVTGECTFEQYAWFMCQGLQPNSPEEQERRTEIAYIKLYGELN